MCSNVLSKNVLKLRKLRDLSIEVTITIFKVLATSEIVHLGLTTCVPAFIILYQLFSKGKNPKYNTLTYEIPIN